MPIDTLKAARRLQEEGTFDEDQAERIAEVLSELDVASATKEDLDDLEGRLVARLDRAEEERASLEERLGGRIDEVEERLTGVEERLIGRTDEVEERLAGRIDEVEERFTEAEERLTGRIDEFEDLITRRIDRGIQKIQSNVGAAIARIERRLLLGGIPTIAAIVAILNYLMG